MCTSSWTWHKTGKCIAHRKLLKNILSCWQLLCCLPSPYYAFDSQSAVFDRQILWWNYMTDKYCDELQFITIFICQRQIGCQKRKKKIMFLNIFFCQRILYFTCMLLIRNKSVIRYLQLFMVSLTAVSRKSAWGHHHVQKEKV